MKIIKKRPLSEVRRDITKDKLEQEITDLEIAQMVQDREITDHDIAIAELQGKINEEV